LGKVNDLFFVVDIPSERHMRQDQVLEHQKGQLDPIINVQSKPAGNLCRSTTSNLGMVTSMAFSNVMEQDTKNEDLILFN